MKPFLDNWGRGLLAFGLGAVAVVFFVVLGLNPVFLFAGWLVALVGWLAGCAIGIPKN